MLRIFDSNFRFYKGWLLWRGFVGVAPKKYIISRLTRVADELFLSGQISCTMMIRNKILKR
jgi:hypothetical protein